MSTELKQQTIPASGELVVSQTANFLFLLSAAAAVDVRFQSGGTTYGAVGVSAGYVKGKVQPWDRAVMKGPAGTAVTYFIGTEELREDITDFRQQIATIAGIVAVAMQPASSVANTAPVVRATATTGVLFAQNLNRKRMTVYPDSGNAGSCFARTAGGANNIAELQPGLPQEFEGTYALDVRNDTGANATFYLFEES